MGDPVGAARHAHQALADDGTVLLVEPFAGDSLEENCNPVGRMFYVGVDVRVHAELAVTGSRPRPRRTSRRSPLTRCLQCSRLHAVPARHRDAVQPHPRSAQVATPALPTRHAHAVLARVCRADWCCSVAAFGAASISPAPLRLLMRLSTTPNAITAAKAASLCLSPDSNDPSAGHRGSPPTNPAARAEPPGIRRDRDRSRGLVDDVAADVDKLQLRTICCRPLSQSGVANVRCARS